MQLSTLSQYTYVIIQVEHGGPYVDGGGLGPGAGRLLRADAGVLELEQQVVGPHAAELAVYALTEIRYWESGKINKNIINY